MAVLKKLISIKNQIDAMPPFKGRAAAKRKIEENISFLNRYKTKGDNIEDLFLKNAEKTLELCKRKQEEKSKWPN